MDLLRGHKVSIIIPVYNEALAIREILDRVMRSNTLGADKEIVIVDDGSSDETLALVKSYISQHPEGEKAIRSHHTLINHGKGAALRAGFQIATGDIFLIQDGDLEYSPEEYEKLLLPFADPKVNIVYGNRFHAGYPRGMKTLNLIANKILSLVVTVLYGQKIQDEATGYKVFRKEVLNNMKLQSRGFEFCPEFTSKALISNYSILEIPISYNPRGVLEGKKIKARDGIIAVWWLLRIRFLKKA